MKQLKVVFIDADTKLGDHISNVLVAEYNYKVHFQNTSLGILSILEDFAPDIMILDIEIDGRTGIETATQIISKHPDIPILFVSSLRQEEWVIRGIDIGAMAYILKPISVDVLISYINRFALKNNEAHLIKFANFQLNLHSNELRYQNKLVKRISTLEKNTLALFLQQPNKIIGKELLLEKVWGENRSMKGNMGSLHNIISKLRDLLKANKAVQIDCIRGVGYLLRWQ